jgi:hypothetical protein
VLRVSVQIPLSQHTEVKKIAQARGVFINKAVEDLMQEALTRYKMRTPAVGQVTLG